MKNIKPNLNSKQYSNNCNNTCSSLKQPLNAFINRKFCTLDKRKDPVPKLKDLVKVKKEVNDEVKNHVYGNITRLKTLKRQQHPLVVQDSKDGHCQDTEMAGLKLKYVFKKNYGCTPSYIKRKQEELKVQKQQENCRQSDTNKIHAVSEEEKNLILEGLRNNLRNVERKLLALPIIIDTISKRKRKEQLENCLEELQKDIEILEKNDIIVISN